MGDLLSGASVLAVVGIGKVLRTPLHVSLEVGNALLELLTDDCATLTGEIEVVGGVDSEVKKRKAFLKSADLLPVERARQL